MSGASAISTPAAVAAPTKASAASLAHAVERTDAQPRHRSDMAHDARRRDRGGDVRDAPDDAIGAEHARQHARRIDAVLERDRRRRRCRSSGRIGFRRRFDVPQLDAEHHRVDRRRSTPDRRSPARSRRASASDSLSMRRPSRRMASRCASRARRTSRRCRPARASRRSSRRRRRCPSLRCACHASTMSSADATNAALGASSVASSATLERGEGGVRIVACTAARLRRHADQSQ